MKLVFTILSILFLCVHSNNSVCQSIPNFNPNEVMSSDELAQYRQSIWDSLPAAVGWVNDFEGIFSASQGDTLESMIAHFEKASSIEIAIVTVDTNMVAREKFTAFTERLLKVWGIGKKLKRNGIVILVSSGYKQIEIITDAGIDPFMTEPQKIAIIKKVFVPEYKRDHYFEGTYLGLKTILTTMAQRLYIHIN